MPKSLLVDTNILLMHVVGSWDRSEVGRLRRTEQFSPSDFDLLQSEINKYNQLVATVAVLTEVSDLIPSSLHVPISESFAATCQRCTEHVVAMDDALLDRAFARLGFADACVLHAASPDTTILTDDVELYLEVLYRGYPAINFNHLRGQH
jgi:hypothetical protein